MVLNLASPDLGMIWTFAENWSKTKSDQTTHQTRRCSLIIWQPCDTWFSLRFYWMRLYWIGASLLPVLYFSYPSLRSIFWQIKGNASYRAKGAKRSTLCREMQAHYTLESRFDQGKLLLRRNTFVWFRRVQFEGLRNPRNLKCLGLASSWGDPYPACECRWGGCRNRRCGRLHGLDPLCLFFLFKSLHISSLLQIISAFFDILHLIHHFQIFKTFSNTFHHVHFFKTRFHSLAQPPCHTARKAAPWVLLRLANRPMCCTWILGSRWGNENEQKNRQRNRGSDVFFPKQL